jgi:hypothetical protein
VFERPFEEGGVIGDENANPSARKLYVFDMIKGFEQRNVAAVILPCFISHTFLDELESEIKLPIIEKQDDKAEDGKDQRVLSFLRKSSDLEAGVGIEPASTALQAAA